MTTLRFVERLRDLVDGVEVVLSRHLGRGA